MTTEQFIENQLAGYTSRATFDLESVKTLMRRVAWFQNYRFISDLEDIGEDLANQGFKRAMDTIIERESIYGREVPDDEWKKLEQL